MESIAEIEEEQGNNIDIIFCACLTLSLLILVGKIIVHLNYLIRFIMLGLKTRKRNDFEFFFLQLKMEIICLNFLLF